MLRSALLYLSSQPNVFKFVRHNRMAKSFAARFVPGETLDTALEAVRQLNSDGITASLDLLGESVRNEKEARESAQQYLKILDRIKETGLDANVSVKLTAMGIDIGEDLCIANMQNILERAREYETFVRIDMEGSDYTQKTLDLFYNRLFPSYRGNVGIVLQSYLYRSFSDVQQANAASARVRLCKGAYKEPATVAYPEKKDVDDSYLRCMRSLLLDGHYPGIATHDERMVRETKRFANDNDIPSDRFEFQMLYGVRRDLQQRLVREGYRMRVYVPFGTQWYPYLMRRLAERPANVAFLTGNVLKEMVGRRNGR
ncbi:MAG TPA: proline dehydrogenase family protein [Gemmatimonadaceae bacterium]|nr:proline dehydrogenase family protein [Gemmatimonadaceae bacterium]